MSSIYRDRSEAGQRLATLLTKYEHLPDLLVLALPRGGVPVAYEIAHSLHAPLDVFLVRKLGVPGQEELAMGAIASGGIRIINDDVVEHLHIPRHAIEKATEDEKRELQRRERLYRDDMPPPSILGHTILLVDDGLATGASMRAAVQALKQQRPAHLAVAVPVAAATTCYLLQTEVDRLICAQTPDPFYGVGYWYQNFAQTSDQEVRDLLTRNHQELATSYHVPKSHS